MTRPLRSIRPGSCCTIAPSSTRARGITRVDRGMGDSGYKQVLGAEHGPLLRDWLLLRPGLPALVGRALRAVFPSARV